jgi:cation diffusion facilitator CzcD-associated flavoprotein CzcO
LHPHIRCNERLESIVQEQNSQSIDDYRWTLETVSSQDPSIHKTYKSKIVVLCTSLNRVPVYPSIPGQEQFQGGNDN